MKLKSLIAFLISSSLVATSTLVHAEVMQIDLTSALRLANDQNTELAIQLERVKRAEIGKDKPGTNGCQR